jgi:hypothetical protein
MGMERTGNDIAVSGDLILNLFHAGYISKEQTKTPELIDAFEKMLITGVALALEAPMWSEEFLAHIKNIHSPPEMERVKRKEFVAEFINSHRWEEDDKQ